MDIKIIASGSSGNAYLIGDGKTRLLLDAGIPFKRIQIGCGFRTSGIDGCLVTHRHGDHAAAIPKLLQRGITVYSNADVAELHEGVQTLTALREHTIGTFRILPFEAEHDVPCYGYQVTSEETGGKARLHHRQRVCEIHLHGTHAYHDRGELRRGYHARKREG